MYNVYMQLPISDARRKLPELVQKARRGEVIEVTVRGEVVARIVAPEAATDDAALRLLAAMRKMGPRSEPRASGDSREGSGGRGNSPARDARGDRRNLDAAPLPRRIASRPPFPR